MSGDYIKKTAVRFDPQKDDAGQPFVFVMF
ncbi:hypothetical protein PBAL39_09076 [Pedobacter sp. BAL39]|nr:hypothetical protein PBAL39_09076 [Pedobacter sp. BAL39]